MPPEEVAELEPAVSCVGAVLSETTGIIDSHAYMESLFGDLEAHDGMIAFHSEVRSGAVDGGRIRIETSEMALDAACVVNAAGLGCARSRAKVACRTHLPACRQRITQRASTTP